MFPRSDHHRSGPSTATYRARCLRSIPASMAILLSMILAPAGLSSGGSTALAMGPEHGSPAQASPTGGELIRLMKQAAVASGTFHEKIVSTSVSRGVQDTVSQNVEVDLRRHRLHQTGVDRRIRVPDVLLSRETFERVSVGYRSATRNGGGAWSCQRFRPGQVRLIGQSTFLASLGRPRHARNLGPAVWRGVPVWHVRATVFGGPAGGTVRRQRADFFIARSNDTLLRETWRPGKGSTASATYSRYGSAVHIVLPRACRPQAGAATTQLTVAVLLHPVHGARAHGTATFTSAGAAARVSLDIGGLPPGRRAPALIHYGVCSGLVHLSASAASLPTLKANAAGRARATGRVVTGIGRQSVRLSVLADGHHAVVIVLPAGGLVACGTIR